MSVGKTIPDFNNPDISAHIEKPTNASLFLETKR